MATADLDWRFLRGSSIFLVVIVLISGAALVGSYQFSKAKDIIHKRENSKYMNVRNQYRTLDEEESLIATYLPRYIALENAGIIGREKRLDWIESLRQSAKQSQVAKLQYKIGAQKVFATGMPLEIGDYKVFASKMSITVDLLHEGDLLSLLDNISRNVTGLYGLRECDIQRIGQDLSTEPDGVNLSALCHMNFLTIRKSAAGERG